jgi:hypothetical protein
MDRQAILTDENPSRAANQGASDEALLTATVRVPQHVVYRDFMNETVVLNLESGKYHGLNPSAGRMLHMLEKGVSLREAATHLAGDYGVAVAELEQDICALCRDLEARGLVEVVLDGKP